MEADLSRRHVACRGIPTREKLWRQTCRGIHTRESEPFPPERERVSESGRQSERARGGARERTATSVQGTSVSSIKSLLEHFYNIIKVLHNHLANGPENRCIIT